MLVLFGTVRDLKTKRWRSRSKKRIWIRGLDEQQKIRSTDVVRFIHPFFSVNLVISLFRFCAARVPPPRVEESERVELVRKDAKRWRKTEQNLAFNVLNAESAYQQSFLFRMEPAGSPQLVFTWENFASLVSQVQTKQWHEQRGCARRATRSVAIILECQQAAKTNLDILWTLPNSLHRRSDSSCTRVGREGPTLQTWSLVVRTISCSFVVWCFLPFVHKSSRKCSAGCARWCVWSCQ